MLVDIIGVCSIVSSHLVEGLSVIVVAVSKELISELGEIGHFSYL